MRTMKKINNVRVIIINIRLVILENVIICKQIFFQGHTSLVSDVFPKIYHCRVSCNFEPCKNLDLDHSEAVKDPERAQGPSTSPKQEKKRIPN